MRFVLTFILMLLLSGCSDPVFAQELTASYYTVESCLKESGQYVMANGKELNDEKFTAASWFYKFGTVLNVTRTDTGKTIQVIVTDRGPNWKLVRHGRIIDLSLASMRALNGIEQGIVPVRIERIR